MQLTSKACALAVRCCGGVLFLRLVCFRAMCFSSGAWLLCLLYAAADAAAMCSRVVGAAVVVVAVVATVGNANDEDVSAFLRFVSLMGRDYCLSSMLLLLMLLLFARALLLVLLLVMQNNADLSLLQ